MRGRGAQGWQGLVSAVWLLSACTASLSPAPPSPTPAVESIENLLDQRFNAYLSGIEAYGALGLENFRGRLDDDPPAFVLDVRTAAEAEATGHIAGAVRIPLQELASRTDRLPGFDTTIVTYCGSGWRCTMALPVLAALGWNSVYTLGGGSLSGWLLLGYPVVPGSPPEPAPLDKADPDPRVVEHMQQVLADLPDDDGAIKPESLSQALSEEPDLVLIDIRSPDEIQAHGFIPSDDQLRIPIDELVSRRSELPKEKDARIVTYCGTGYRCLLAMMMLRSYGYQDVRTLVGGLKAWQDEGYPVAQGP